MAAVGHMSLVGDSNPHALMMQQLRDQGPMAISRLSVFTEKNSYDVTSRKRSSSDGNSESNDDGDVIMSDDDILDVDEEDQQPLRSPTVTQSVILSSCSPTHSHMENHSPRYEIPPLKSEGSFSKQEMPLVLPVINIAPPATQSTNFSIDRILCSDFGSSSSSLKHVSNHTKPVSRHRKFDFSVEALSSQYWSGADVCPPSAYYATGGFSPPPTSSRHGAPSPTSSISISPGSSVSPSSSISPIEVHSTSTNSATAADMGLSPLCSPLSSPNTSPSKHYRTRHHRRPTIAPYPCNTSVLKALQQQTQQQQSYFQHLINTTATTHELLASHTAGYHHSPYTTGTPTILNHRYTITDKLGTGADHRESSSYNRVNVGLSIRHYAKCNLSRLIIIK